MSLEIAAVAIALIGTGIATYFDIFNRRNIPEALLYAFLVISAVFGLLNPGAMYTNLFVGVLVFAVGYLFYRMGHIGEADVFVLAALALLIPSYPSFLPGTSGYMPFIITVIIISGILFSAYAFVKYAIPALLRIRKLRTREMIISGALLIAFLVFLYVISQMGIFTIWYYLLFAYLLLLSLVFMYVKDEIKKSMIENISISKIEEGDVIGTEYLDKKYIELHHIPRVFNEKNRGALNREKIKTLPVYTKMPPFLPFILLGLILSLITGELFSYLVTFPVYLP